MKKIEYWLKRGAIGIGESKFHLEVDSPPMLRLYAIAREWNVPILMHFQHKTYNMGFERMAKILQKFPTVNFIGHAQTWWGNIHKGHDQAVMYPKGRVTPGGITDALLSDFPNMYGDLSAGSGLNAMLRDDRSNSGTFNDSSKRFSCIETADCVRCRNPAARVTPPLSATATKARNRVRSISRAISNIITSHYYRHNKHSFPLFKKNPYLGLIHKDFSQEKGTGSCHFIRRSDLAIGSRSCPPRRFFWPRNWSRACVFAGRSRTSGARSQG